MNGSSFSGVLNDEIDLYSETIEIRRSILCIICLGTYFNPVRLPCSHTFCGHCILEASRVKLRCPICSAEFSKRSINRVPNLSKVIGDIDALVKSLTADNRFSIPTEKLDEQYRERQRAVRLENQHVQSTSSSSLQTVIFKQRKFSSESCRSINVDVDTTSSSSVKLTIGALLELPSSTSDDVAHAHGIKILPCQQNSDLSPQRLSDILCRSQSPQVELAASDLHSVNGSEDTNSSPRIQPDAISSLSRRVTQEEAAERSLSVTKSVLPSSSIKTTNPVGIVPAIQLPESATITAQVASSNSSRTDEITANFRPGEVVEVTARMWPGMNKPGGAAWILLVHQHPADPAAGIEASVYYDVKYVLHGNSDLSVHCSFVKPVLELSRGSRKRGLEPGPPPVSAPTPARGGQAQSHKRKIAVLKSLHMETEVCTKHMSVRSAELHRGPSVLGSSSSSEGTVEKPRVAVALDHSTLSKKNRNQRGQSAQRKEREQEQGREKYPPSSASTTASQREWSVCISHTSLENADVLKLDKFIQKFSNSLRDQSCPSSSSSTSSSTLHPISSLSPRDVCTKRPSSCTLTDIFDSNITHLIVSVDKKRLLRKRTLKFMQAIMAGLWILTPQWLSDSILAGRILPEEGYEVSGYQKAVTAFAPRRARLNVLATRAHTAALDSSGEVYATPQSRMVPFERPLGPPSRSHNLLFFDRVFLLYGSFPNSGPPRSKIADLLMTGQAVVVSSIDELCRHRCRRNCDEGEVLSEQQWGGSGSGFVSVSASEGAYSKGGSGRRGGGREGQVVKDGDVSILSRAPHGDSPSKYAKIVVCTDSESVLSFVEEVTKLLQGNLGREQLHILSNAAKDESSVGMRHRGMPKRIFLRMSEKYPVEGCNVLLSALAAVNSKSQNAYVTYSCTALSKENIENENDSSSKPEEINSNVDEITILNPIWLFDSIANYSLATIA